MASLKLLLGWIPSTDKIEENENSLISEYKRLKDFACSDILKKYNELKELVSSSDFLRKKKEIISLNYSDSEEYSKEKEFLSLRKSKDIIFYFRTIADESLKNHQKLNKSETIASFENLEKEILSTEFQQKRKIKGFKRTEEAKKLLKYRKLKKSPEIKSYYKFKKSKAYNNYLKINDSPKLKKFRELEEFVSSKEFKEKKEFLLDKKRFEKTEMFKQNEEYLSLCKNEDIIWYFKTKDSDKFDTVKNRILTFSDEFEGTSLNSKWLTNYYWGDKLLNDRYSVENDLQAYTENNNFEIKNSILTIITKAKKTTGKVWTAQNGFYTKEFAYTSGIINTGKSFRQKYGTFSAKIKLGNSSAKNAFWMLSDKITPHIDICKTSSKKISMDFFSTPDNMVKASLGARYTNDFFIYTLEWTPDKLVWKINNVKVLEQTEDIPQEPMYVILSGGLDKPVNCPVYMEIDWIRIYK